MNRIIINTFGRVNDKILVCGKNNDNYFDDLEIDYYLFEEYYTFETGDIIFDEELFIDNLASHYLVKYILENKIIAA